MTADAREKDSKTDKPAPPPGHLVIQVYNEDAGGPPFTVAGGPGEKVSKMVKADCPACQGLRAEIWTRRYTG